MVQPRNQFVYESETDQSIDHAACLTLLASGNYLCDTLDVSDCLSQILVAMTTTVTELFCDSCTPVVLTTVITRLLSAVWAAVPGFHDSHCY
jgi:hypothetical protein